MVLQRKKTKKSLALWIEKDLYDTLTLLARQKGIPRSFFVENFFRKELGLPLLEEPGKNTPKIYLPNSKKTK